jgi:protein TonB
VPTVVSVVLHAWLLAMIWALAASPEPEEAGTQISVVLTPDLLDLEEPLTPDMPRELPEFEPLEVPSPKTEPLLEPEPTLEPLDQIVVTPRPAPLPLSLAKKRVKPSPPDEQAPPPAPRPPPPRVAPPRGTPQRDRLRPILTPVSYPESAQRAQLEGRVRVVMTIDARGAVVHVLLQASSGHAVLDEAAMRSAKRWRFKPPGQMRRAAQTFEFALP